jgi:hypothetical protein
MGCSQTKPKADDALKTSDVTYTKKSEATEVSVDTPATSDSEDDAVRLPDGSIIEEEDDEDDDEGDAAPSPKSTPAGMTESHRSLYGKPLSPDQAAELCPAGGGGLIWHAQLLTEEDTRNPRYCTPDGRVKPRRANLPVKAADFFASLVRTSDGRWLFSGVLNGWPGLTCLEVRSITFVIAKKSRSSVSATSRLKRTWNAGDAHAPSMPDGHGSVRATLRAARWSAKGYAPGVCGFVWWWFHMRDAPVFAHGEDILRQMANHDGGGAAASGKSEELVTAVRAHLFSHRYARGTKKESVKDQLTCGNSPSDPF